ncbi:MBL fold metallo-hydrolase [Candidatus Uhrbacteria bacterium]|nr:MBL fold metallo-hydrolase [Candidatus Uhrbacteria bacterium]
MQFVSHGLGCVDMTAKHAQGEMRVVMDPYASSVGMRPPRLLKADLIVASHDAPESHALEGIEGKPFVIDIPGEYEVGGIFCYALPVPRKDGSAHFVSRLTAEGLEVAHLGALDRPLSEEELKLLGDVDILFVPVGGGVVLDAETAAEVVTAIEPRAVVPIYFGASSIGVKELGPEKFLRALGSTSKEEQVKWKVAKKDLTEDVLQVVVLRRE